MTVSCVMFVDDSEGDQFLCKIMMEEYDPTIKILQAYNGLEALEILDNTETSPDVIFLDINMPRMNGHEFLEEYDKREGEKSTVIIMLTSSDQDVDRERSMAYNCVKNYIIKPLESNCMSNVFKF